MRPVHSIEDKVRIKNQYDLCKGMMNFAGEKRKLQIPRRTDDSIFVFIIYFDCAKSNHFRAIDVR